MTVNIPLKESVFWRLIASTVLGIAGIASIINYRWLDLVIVVVVVWGITELVCAYAFDKFPEVKFKR